jgi:hypothetical protein
VALSTVQFAALSAAAWTLTSGVLENLSYRVVVPAGGYTLNSTTVFVPFPAGVPISGASVGVTLAGSNVTSVQVVAGGVYVVLPSLAASATLNVTATVSASTSGWVSTKLGPVYLYSAATNQYRANATWFNRGSLPYGGGVVVTTNLSYPINPVGLNVSANGKWLKNGTFFLQGPLVEVLPGVVNVSGGGPLILQLTFYLAGAPPNLLACLTCAVYGTVTLGELLEVGMLIFVVTAFAGAIRAGREVRVLGITKRNDLWWGSVILFFVVAGFYVVFYLLQFYP